MVKPKILVMDKHAQGHVEMILAFVIFIGFVGTLFFFLNPVDNKAISYTLLDITQEKLLASWSDSYQTISLILDDSAISQMASSGKSCFMVANQPELTGNLIARDELNNLKSAYVSTNNLLIGSTSQNKYYKLSSSNSFSSSTPSDCETILSSNYKFGSLTTQNTVVYENIESFIIQANDPEGYIQLKQDLGLQNDFEVRVYEIDIQGNLNLVMNATRFVPRVVEVVARDVPLITIDKQAVKKDIIVNIRAW